MVASVIANAIGVPICGSLLDLNGVLGLRGWQWMFLVTGVPAIVMAGVTLLLLPDGPETAKFLSESEKRFLARTIADENAAMGKLDHKQSLRAALDWRILLQAVGGWGFPLGVYGLSYWLPTVVKGFGVSNAANGFLNMIPAFALRASCGGCRGTRSGPENGRSISRCLWWSEQRHSC